MKLILLLLVTVFAAHAALAQFTITTGAQLSMTGPTQLTLNNTSFINHGSFAAGTGTVSFTGNGPNSIGGSQPVQFSELEINKSSNAFVLLLRPIAITSDLLFNTGILNLNSFNADLGTTGIIINENESGRVTGPDGGEVLFNVNLNAPADANPANLGLFITTAQNLGNVTIHRGHKPQVNNTGNVTGIQRYYEIVPANNAALNATLAFRYLDGELNNLPENSLSLFESDDNIKWKNLGVDTRNPTANFVEKNGISALGRLTLFNANLVLPVHFIAISANCENNIQHYSIERSEDGNTWAAIGRLPSGLTGAAENSYTFRDNAPLQNGQYRVSQVDLNGAANYSSIVRGSCAPADLFTVFPNPVHGKLFINIVAASNSTALIQLFDSKGALVKQQADNIRGNANQLMIDMGGLPKGMYHLSVQWNKGQTKRTVQVVKD
jgi:hypothetical protein